MQIDDEGDMLGVASGFASSPTPRGGRGSHTRTSSVKLFASILEGSRKILNQRIHAVVDLKMGRRTRVVCACAGRRSPAGGQAVDALRAGSRLTGFLRSWDYDRKHLVARAQSALLAGKAPFDVDFRGASPQLLGCLEIARRPRTRAAARTSSFHRAKEWRGRSG
jgi:hypothetical protein